MLGLLTVVLAVTGPVDAVISRSIDTTPERADDLLARVVLALAQAGIAMRDPAETRKSLPEGTVPSACAARRACVRELGVALGAQAVVGVDVGHVTGQMAVNLEAVSTADGQRLARLSFAIDSAGYPAGIDGPLKAFARALKIALQPIDAPVAVKLEPEPKPREAPVQVQVVLAAPSRNSGHLVPIVLGGTAVAATVVAVALAVIGSSTARQIDLAKVTYMGKPSSKISRGQADDLASSANGQYAGSGVCAGAAIALGAGALLWWRLGD